MKKKGFTLVELLVVIAIIALLLAILMPALNKVRQLANRLVCGSNLGGLGKAIYAYANDYHEQFPRFGPAGCGWGPQFEGTFTWDKLPSKVKDDWNTLTQAPTTATLYLLVKYSDVSTGSFVCKSSSQKKFEITSFGDATQQNYTPPGQISNLIQAWDFGAVKGTPPDATNGPWDYCSYAYQMPYPIAGTSNAMGLRISHTNFSGLAVMADSNPWFGSTGTKKQGGIIPEEKNIGPYLLRSTDFGATEDGPGDVDKTKARLANSRNHGQDGQNVLYGDWHVNFESTPCVGIEKDNIYTVWDPKALDASNGNVQELWPKAGGVMPTGSPYTSTTKDISQSDDDSFLVN